jgi:hypothetical protein
MPFPGVAEFEEPYLLDEYYLDGAFIPARPVQSDPAPGLFALPTHGGTHVMQRPYRGEAKPKSYHALRFSLEVRAVDGDSWKVMKRAKAKAAPFYFACGKRQTDTFPATSGSTYRLSRPLAAGIVPGVNEAGWPTIVLLNGVEDPSAASVSGQNVLANDTGTITVEYTPVHLVYFVSFPEAIDEHNALDASVELEEILIP